MYKYRYLLGSSSSSSSASSQDVADAFVAEHVWEHLSLEAAHIAARNCYTHLSPGGTLRIAVPDPNHQSDAPTPRGSLRQPLLNSHSSSSNVDSTATATAVPAARMIAQQQQHSGAAAAVVEEQLKLPNWLQARHLAADMRDGHSAQYTVQLLSSVCAAAGFADVVLQEWSDSSGQFHSRALQNGETLQADAHMFGAVKRSAAERDVRGGVSIVLDCVKGGDAPRSTAAQLPSAGNATL
jgi:predicted SAM-dependent methyltransferase